MAHRMIAPREAATDDEDSENERISETDSLISGSTEEQETAGEGRKLPVVLTGHVVDIEDSPVASEDEDSNQPAGEERLGGVLQDARRRDRVDRDENLREEESMLSLQATTIAKTDSTKETQESLNLKSSSEGVVEVKRKSRRPFDIPVTGDFYMHDDRSSGAVTSTLHKPKFRRPAGRTDEGINASRWKHDKFEEMEREFQQLTTRTPEKEIPTRGGRWVKNQHFPARGERTGDPIQDAMSSYGHRMERGAPGRGHRGRGRSYSGRFGGNKSQFSALPTQSSAPNSFNSSNDGWTF